MAPLTPSAAMGGGSTSSPYTTTTMSWTLPSHSNHNSGNGHNHHHHHHHHGTSSRSSGSSPSRYRHRRRRNIPAVLTLPFAQLYSPGQQHLMNSSSPSANDVESSRSVTASVNVVTSTGAGGSDNSSSAGAGTATVAEAPPNMHHHFRTKTVCRLSCSDCGTRVCVRGMKAMLLADTRIELYSTDIPPESVQLVGDDYMTQNCRCKIRDVGCLTCGNILGYHITQPCRQCMEACNNGHFWMFHTEAVASEERADPADAKRPLLWAHLPRAEREAELQREAEADEYVRFCR